MKPTLIILAAGVGSRYGGLKQLDLVGPGGATLMDYTIFDAVREGFRRVVRRFHPARGPKQAVGHRAGGIDGCDTP
jgi:CTP:molybdopterin cytidylyltransferase MocA